RSAVRDREILPMGSRSVGLQQHQQKGLSLEPGGRWRLLEYRIDGKLSQGNRRCVLDLRKIPAAGLAASYWRKNDDSRSATLRDAPGGARIGPRHEHLGYGDQHDRENPLGQRPIPTAR